MSVNVEAIEAIGAPVVSEVWAQVILPLVQEEVGKISNAELKAAASGIVATMSALIEAELAKIAAPSA
jgi:hypothetical protein